MYFVKPSLLSSINQIRLIFGTLILMYSTVASSESSNAESLYLILNEAMIGSSDSVCQMMLDEMESNPRVQLMLQEQGTSFYSKFSKVHSVMTASCRRAVSEIDESDLDNVIITRYNSEFSQDAISDMLHAIEAGEIFSESSEPLHARLESVFSGDKGRISATLGNLSSASNLLVVKLQAISDGILKNIPEEMNDIAPGLVGDVEFFRGEDGRIRFKWMEDGVIILH